MLFFVENLKDTLEAINKLIDDNVYIVNTKKIRRYHNIKSSDRSKINFIWRSLNYLEEKGVLIPNGAVKPKRYKIKSREKIDVEKFISQIDWKNPKK